MEATLPAYRDSYPFFHYERPRLNSLFRQAAQYPLVMLCAGSGYGKTSAVCDFTRQYPAHTAWMQLSEHDNDSGAFWKNYIHALSQSDEIFARAIDTLGFPDTQDKLSRYTDIARCHAGSRWHITVMDDFHHIEAPVIIRFVEHLFLSIPPGCSLFLMSRCTPRVNTAAMSSKGRVFNLSEDELRFTKAELAQYFRHAGIPLQPENGYPNDVLHEIMKDTEGWAFAISLIAQSYRKAPGYTGYLRIAVKAKIFQSMKTEVWDVISDRLRHFLIQISLINHLSVDLINLLADMDRDIIDELERQSAYVRSDKYINAYQIHPLFLEFLAQQEELVSQEQKHKTYAIAGKWCDRNDFKTDAMSYYERTGDYASIVDIFIALPLQIPQDIARCAESIIEQAPQEAFDTVLFLACAHVRSVLCQGNWQKAMKLAERYEEKYLGLPKSDRFGTASLASIYCCQAVARFCMALRDGRYDFDRYLKKIDGSFFYPANPGSLTKFFPGPWICAAGSARKGAPQEFIDALKRAAGHGERYFNTLSGGEDDLAFGELKFYQGDTHAAKTYFARAIDRAREKRHPEVAHRALLYCLRIAFFNGDYQKAGWALKEMKAQLDETDYFNRFVNYDISLAWYYYSLDMPEEVPEWVQEVFSPYCHAGFIENFINQVKARYCYMKKNYPPLLSYTQEMRQRESYVFGRVEILAMEACVHYKMKNRKKACDVLTQAYEQSSPNTLLMPFIELGKDMRTLTAFALKEGGCGIPQPWLEAVNRKSSSYAKQLAHVAAKYRQASGITAGIAISPREGEILTDLSHGLSRTEIAASRSISINTVKMIISNVYVKLGAESLAEAIRIAAERKII
ncbi:MAG: LuxR C-terminal-related transcriptional regulator [Treponema sp.]|nr:LuxR C-terminal-related transcriptional regulator [Treponema sp.]